jgi:hypothetical protein
MLAFILASMLVPAPGRAMTAREVEHMTPAALAARLLPPADAARIAGGRSQRWLTPWQAYNILLWERSEPVGPMLCRRPTWSTIVADPTGRGAYDDQTVPLAARGNERFNTYGATYPDPATAERCARVVGYVGASPEQAENVIQAIGRLTEAMHAAASPGPLPFALRCRTENQAHDCTDERAALASLSLDELHTVSFQRSYYTAPGAPPPPSGEPVMPTMEFGMSAPDGRSWFVTLIGDSGGLREVLMWRLMVIYH